MASVVNLIFFFSSKPQMPLLPISNLSQTLDNFFSLSSQSNFKLSRKNMKLLIVFTLLIVFANAIEGQEKFPNPPPGPAPCVLCTREVAHVCAQPIKGGPAKTFLNSCHVLAQDCSFSEPRKNLNAG